MDIKFNESEYRETLRRLGIHGNEQTMAVDLIRHASGAAISALLRIATAAPDPQMRVAVTLLSLSHVHEFNGQLVDKIEAIETQLEH